MRARSFLALTGLGLVAPASAQDWVVLRPSVTEATGATGATIFEVLEDESVLVDARDEVERYRIECPTSLEGITAVRLEVLPHIELPRRGPGLADGGNFVLSELRVQTVVGRGSRWVELSGATASYSQVGWPVLAAIDSRNTTGWAVDGRIAERSEAVFVFRRPLGKGKRTLVFDMEFRYGKYHAIGRFRLSATSDPDPRAAGSDFGVGALQGQIDSSTRRGADYLLSRQELDGSWSEHQNGYRSGCTALSIYSLIKSGVSPEHQGVRRGLAFLEAHPARKTYEAGCHLLLCAALDHDRWREHARATLDSLIDWQRSDWGYPDGAADLSNTQYAALGLWSATKMGLAVPPPVWERLAERVLEYQKDDGGFGYRPGDNPTGSMSAAGVTVLAICEPHVNPELHKPVMAGLRRGLEWLDEFFSPVANEGAPNARFFYYLYGIERVGALTDVQVFNNQDWYFETARRLLEIQKGGGNWADPGWPQINTCFALLTLRRATMSTTGIEQHKGSLYGEDDPEVDISLRAAGDTPLTVWVSSYGDELLDGYTFDGERSPRVVKVEYVTDGGVLLADSRIGGAEWRYATHSPGDGWAQEAAGVKGWRRGLGAFGRMDSPQLSVGTEWKASELWLRRELEVDTTQLVEPHLELSFSAKAAHGASGPRESLLKLYDEERVFAALLSGTTNGSQIVQDQGGAGVSKSSLRVTPTQRFNLKIPGWAFPIREKPTQGEYRYLQFAWRKPRGNVMLQLAFNGSWSDAVRYFAGENEVKFEPAIQVARKAPNDWTVVTRDLWKDLGGKDGLLTGLALTPMNDGQAWFDALYLGRSKGDLNRTRRLRDEPPEWAELRRGEIPEEGEEVVTIWLNGEPVFIDDGETSGFETVLEGAELVDLLRPGVNVLAVHVRNSERGRALDLGLYDARRLAVIEGDSTKPANSDRFGARFSFPRLGRQTLWARVHIVDPVTSEVIVVESEPLTVDIRDVLIPEMLEYATDSARNLLDQDSLRVTSSSALDGWPADGAFDNAQHRGWLCADGDLSPSIHVRLRRPVKADTLLLSHARIDRRDANRTNLPTRVEVILNGKGPGVVAEVDQDRLVKTVVQLGKPQKVRELEVRILDRSEAEDPWLTAVGFAEVELQLRGGR